MSHYQYDNISLCSSQIKLPHLSSKVEWVEKHMEKKWVFWSFLQNITWKQN